MSERNGATAGDSRGCVGWLQQTETKLKGFPSPTVSGDAQVSGITGCLGSQHSRARAGSGCWMYCGIELLNWEALAVVRVTSTPPTRWALSRPTKLIGLVSPREVWVR